LKARYELSELKIDKESIVSKLNSKDEEIEQLYRYIEELKSNKVIEENELELYKSYSLLSDKEREGYNEDIEVLKKKINKLLSELKFT
jgi:chromosome segregation ATPase